MERWVAKKSVQARSVEILLGVAQIWTLGDEWMSGPPAAPRCSLSVMDLGDTSTPHFHFEAGHVREMLVRAKTQLRGGKHGHVERLAVFFEFFNQCRRSALDDVAGNICIQHGPSHRESRDCGDESLRFSRKSSGTSTRMAKNDDQLGLTGEMNNPSPCFRIRTSLTSITRIFIFAIDEGTRVRFAHLEHGRRKFNRQPSPGRNSRQWRAPARGA